MLSLQQLWVVLSLNAALVVVGTLGIAYAFGFLGRSDGRPVGDVDPDGGDWHAEAAGLAEEVSRTVGGFGRPADPDRVSKRLLPLSARLRGLARTAPASVDADDHHRLYELGVACQRVGVEHRPVLGDHASLEVRLDTLRSEADAVRDRFSTADQSKPRSNTAKAR